MDLSSWFRKALLKKNKPESSITTNTNYGSKAERKQLQEEKEEEELGVTDQLRDLVKSFTLETFKNFPLQDDQETKVIATLDSENVRKDLSEWQERHASLVLSKVKEISQLRYVLCPRHLKERQFWKIYFMLVKSFVAPYELNAIRKAKLQRIEKNDEKSLDNAFEVEMAETKRTTSVSLFPFEHELGDGESRNVAEGEVRNDGEDLVKTVQIA